MVWVFGNSPERTPIKDLNDVIYYRQKKQYTDQEFEGSRDLQREIQKGRIIKLEHVPEISSSLPDSISVNQKVVAPSIDLSEVRRVITEVLSEQKSNNIDVKNLATTLVPIIAETVRQEVSRIVQGTGQAVGDQIKANIFVDPEYIPTVNTEGMVSNIEIKEKEISGNEANEAIKALRDLNKITP
jgi:hypothetical protein